MFVKRTRDGLVGFDVVTPLITHFNSKDEPCGILINRGWLVKDMQRTLKHKRTGAQTTVEGVLSEGDLHCKYDSYVNVPNENLFKRIFPDHINSVAGLKNKAFSSKIILKQVDFDLDARQALPDCPTAQDLLEWRVSPARHNAYSILWRYASFVTIFANTAFWIAF